MAKKSNVFQLILLFPYWVNILFGLCLVLTHYWIKFVIALINDPIVNKIPIRAFEYIGWLLAIVFLVVGFFDFYRLKKRKQLFLKQNSLQDLYDISWSDFEYLVTEVFFRAGYNVKQSGGAKADGGIDLLAIKDGHKSIIQCKHWKKQSVGVAVVREMFGVGIHENVDHVYIVTCGYFTKEAKGFANGKPITLINGYKLIDWIKGLKNS